MGVGQPSAGHWQQNSMIGYCQLPDSLSIGLVALEGYFFELYYRMQELDAAIVDSF